jgi:hypothetical protein
MSNNREKLKALLRLSPLVEKPMPFGEFLADLSEHPERIEPAASGLYRAIMAMGVEDPEQEPDPERQMFLKALKENGIPSLKAFYHVSGSQRFATGPIAFLKSAAGGGKQREQMIVVWGGPGCGKDFFKDGMVGAVEAFTEGSKVFIVKGCPSNENPVNLLKLLKKDKLAELAEELGLNELLTKAVEMAPQPCEHCYKQLMGDLEHPVEEPDFDKLEVIPIRLSTRSAGIADWQPGGTVSLVDALNHAQRGFISMPDAFIERNPREGETDERLVLLDATEYKRLPGTKGAGGKVEAARPLDTVILATTNRKAFENFLAEVVPDKDAFTSRCVQLRMPYNTIRVEEVRTYKAQLERYKERCHYDPHVLKVLSTLAVLSRLAKPKSGQEFVHPLDIMRLYQGEPYEPKMRPSSEFSQVWEPRSSSYGSYGGSSSSSYGGGYGSSSSYRSDSSTKKDEEDGGVEKMPTDMPLSAGLLWQFADPLEGSQGLDMRTMLGLLSSINQAGLSKGASKKKGAKAKDEGSCDTKSCDAKDHVHTADRKCISTLEVLMMLRGWMYKKSKAQNNTEEQQAVYDRCLKWLGGPPVPNEEPKAKPDVIESEYRRMLRDMLIQVFAPDYEQRAQKLFNDYKLHAGPAVEGKPTVKDPGMGTVPVNTGLLDDLDCYRVGKLDKDGKANKGALTTEDKALRGQLDSIISVLREEYCAMHVMTAPATSKSSGRRFPSWLRPFATSWTARSALRWRS